MPHEAQVNIIFQNEFYVQMVSYWNLQIEVSTILVHNVPILLTHGLQLKKDLVGGIAWYLPYQNIERIWK